MTAAALVLVLREAALLLREARLPGVWTLEVADLGLEVRGRVAVRGDELRWRGVIDWDALTCSDAPEAFMRITLQRARREVSDALLDPTR